MRSALPLLAVLALTACAGTSDEASDGGARDEPPPPASAAAGEPLRVETFDDLSHEHVDGAVRYPQQPPVGGPHHPRWLACDVYDEPVPVETAVHSMEHGAVWVTYRRDVDAAGVAALAELAALDPEYVVVSPYEELPAPVVASSWGVQLQAEGPDDPRLRPFVERYAGGDQGGEPGAPCRGSGLTLDEAQQALGETGAAA